MKVLLVQPNTSTIQGTVCPPLGIMYVGAVARDNGYDVKILDRNIDFFSLTKMKRIKPDILGVSVMTGPMIKDALLVSRKAKMYFGWDFPIVWGGVHPTILPEQTLQDENVDYVVRGEGEKTFSELVMAIEKGLSLSEVKGIGYKNNGKVVLTEERPLIANLDDLPMTPWDMISAKQYLDIEIVLVTSRGCPFRCSFCISSKINIKWRSMSAKRVLEEVSAVEKLTNNTHIKFHDDLMTADKKRFYQIVDGLSDKYSVTFYSRVDHIDDDLLDKLQKFPHVWLSFGVESGSQRILNLMNKRITVETTKKAFALCKKFNNIHPKASVVLGSPGETRQELEATLALMKEIKPTRHTYCAYTPYPGSLWYDQAVATGMFIPPETLEKWSDLHIHEVDCNRKLNMDPKLMNQIFRYGWIETIKNIFSEKEIDWYKIYQRFRDYRPFLAKNINFLEGKAI